MADNTTTKAGRREWLGLAVLAFPAFLISIDFSVLTLAVPKISEALHPSATELLWVVDIYGFMLAGFLVIMGSLGDKIGSRKLLLMGASAFGIGSIAAAFSPNVLTLLAARALLGIAGATLLPSTFALIGTMFPDKRRRSAAIAIWSTSLPVGGAIGPLVGGLVLNSFWWGAVFLISVPAMLILVASGPALLPERLKSKQAHPDIKSAGLLLAAILVLIYGLQELAEDNAPVWVSLTAIALGLLAARAFVVRQRRLTNPLVDMRLFRIPAFSTALAANLFSYFVIIGILMLFAQYLQLVVGLTPLAAGLWTLPAMFGLIGGSLATPLIARHAHSNVVICLGLIVSAVGFALLGFVGPLHGLAVSVIASAIFSIGVAVVTTLVVNVVLEVAPPDRTGAASGLSETSTELGGALGIAALGTLAAVLYRSQLSSHLPLGLPPAARLKIQSTLGGAVDTTHHLTQPAAQTVLTEAQRAFLFGLRAAGIASAGIMLGLAILIVFFVRRGPAADANDAKDAA